MATKICTLCKKELPLSSEYYHRVKSSKDGFRTRCKQCRKTEESPQIKKERQTKWRKENKEREIEYRKQYYKENKEHLLPRSKAYQKETRALRTAVRLKYRRLNIEKSRAWSRNYYERNAERLKDWQRQWRKDNPERVREIDRNSSQKRKAILLKLPHSFKRKDWVECKKHFNNSCAYCGEKSPLTQDHFVPVSKDGEYTKSNIVPACRSCNSSKSNKDFFEWYKTKTFYSLENEQKILKYLGYTENNTQQIKFF